MSTYSVNSITTGSMIAGNYLGPIITAPVFTITPPNTFNYVPNTFNWGPGHPNYYLTTIPYNCYSFTSYDLSKDYGEDLLIGFIDEYAKDKLYSLGSKFSYELVANTYVVLVEKDLTDDTNKLSKLDDFHATRRGLAVIAYDTILNRLEMSSVCKEDEVISNIDALLDDNLQIKGNKDEYFSSLRSRFLPIVNSSFIAREDNMLKLQKHLGNGLLPSIHASNYLLNLSNKTNHKASKIIESIPKEVYLVDKTDLPNIQPYFTPEYCYLSLRPTQEITKALNIFNKSKEGLIELLTNITIPGTKVLPFVNLVIEHCALNQNIIDIEAYAYITIRHLIEQNIL